MVTALVLGLWAGGTGAQEPASLRFEAVPGVPVQVRLLDDGALEARVGHDGVVQRLVGVADEQGGARLSHEDVDFDGHPDLVVRASVGQVNEAVAVFRYAPGLGRLQPLMAPAGTQASCDGLWSLSTDASTGSVVSTCRSGPMWYTDVYRYQAGQLYLYRAERLTLLEGRDLASLLAIKPDDDAGPLAVWTSWDAAGRVRETAISDGLVMPGHDAPLHGVQARVVPPRLPLYTHPGDPATRRYLVAGDAVELRDERDGWLQVRFQSPTHGQVTGWVKVALP